MKRASSMAIQIVVAAALALLVLVVLAFIFSDKVGRATSALDQCEDVGGVWVETGECPAEMPMRYLFARDSDREGKCCVDRLLG